MEAVGRQSTDRAAGIRAPHRRVGRAGFTLVEVLVAVGAFALIAAGLAAIFQATGRVVTTGRRVSAFTSAAAAIERQLRADFEAMTRDGFLLIYNEYAAEANPVPLSPDQPQASWRARRTDEIMFFTRGDFASAREALYPGHTARSNAASIYYGHGHRARQDTAVGSLYRVPEVDNSTVDPTIRLGVDAAGNPNRYAADWTLLRRATLLTGPRSTSASLPPPATGLALADSELQVGLQPAAAHLSRRLADVTPDAANLPPSSQIVRGSVRRPRLASGIVDVTTTDLADIRSIVNTVAAFPAQISSEADLAANLDSIFTPGPMRQQQMQAWMADMMPAHSTAAIATQRQRVRSEPAPPDYFGAISTGTANQQAYRRADQTALTTANFLPRCTEFIVEWSFGKVDGQGGTIWHGMERDVPSGSGPAVRVAEPYSYNGSGVTDDQFQTVYRLRTPLSGAYGQYGQYSTLSAVIHATGLGAGSGTTPVISYFGFVDPLFNPDDPDGNPGTADQAALASIPWAWPELIRITVTLADPTDPLIEETFEFVLPAPGNPAP